MLWLPWMWAKLQLSENEERARRWCKSCARPNATPNAASRKLFCTDADKRRVKDSEQVWKKSRRHWYRIEIKSTLNVWNLKAWKLERLKLELGILLWLLGTEIPDRSGALIAVLCAQDPEVCKCFKLKLQPTVVHLIARLVCILLNPSIFCQSRALWTLLISTQVSDVG